MFIEGVQLIGFDFINTGPELDGEMTSIAVADYAPGSYVSGANRLVVPLRR